MPDPGHHAFKSVCLAFPCHARFMSPSLHRRRMLHQPSGKSPIVSLLVSWPWHLLASLSPNVSLLLTSCPPSCLSSCFPHCSPFIALIMDALIASRLVPVSSREGPFPKNYSQSPLFHVIFMQYIICISPTHHVHHQLHQRRIQHPDHEGNCPLQNVLHPTTPSTGDTRNQHQETSRKASTISLHRSCCR